MHYKVHSIHYCSVLMGLLLSLEEFQQSLVSRFQVIIGKRSQLYEIFTLCKEARCSGLLSSMSEVWRRLSSLAPMSLLHSSSIITLFPLMAATWKAVCPISFLMARSWSW